jgi:Tfp pilus assembly protein PilX
MKYLRNQKGSALALTLILMLLVTILGSAMLFSVSSEIKLNRAIEDQTIARYLAQAGIDHGLHMLETEGLDLDLPYEEEIELEGTSRMYNFEIEEDDDEIVIKSKGIIKISGDIIQQVILEATIDEDGEVTIEE